MISFADAMEWCKAESEDGAVVEALCVAATRIAQDETGLYLGPPQSVTEVLATPPPVMLRGAPSGALALEEWRGGGWTMVAASDYHVDGDMLRPGAGWAPAAPVRLRATYTTGYADGAAPRDLQVATLGLVAHMFENRGDGMGTTGAAVATEIPGWVQQVFRLHRRVAV